MPESPIPGGSRAVDAVLLDAMGTLVHLDAPIRRLARALAAEGYPHADEAVASALRAEIGHYRRNHLRGTDRASLAVLRAECAEVLAAELGGRAPAPSRLVPMLLASLRYRPSPDALPALRALRATGVGLAVVSNWDHSLPRVLEDAGLMGYLDAVVTSADVGAAKPDPAVFAAALATLGVPPARALHCGDEPALDVAGARAAGVRPLLIRRSDARSGGEVPILTSLVQVREYVVRSQGPL